MLIPARRLVLALLLPCAVWTGGSSSRADRDAGVAEPAAIAAYRAAADGQVSSVVVELRSPRIDVAPNAKPVDVLRQQAQARRAQQDAFIASLPGRGIDILPATVDAPQADGSVRSVTYRYTNVLNGFAAYATQQDIERLRRQPEVRAVHLETPMRLHLNRAIDYSLGQNFEPADRRPPVYGATEEMLPAGGGDHPETPKTTTIDGYEGQGIVLSVIDTGVDWKHPMFGGTGHTTATPQIPPNSPAPSDNTKVTYLVNFSAGDPGDDYGHGTFVASNSAGYRVDGSTPPNPGYGTGVDGTGVGPTPSGEVLHGMAPQSTIMGYKTLSAAGTGVNNSTQLALDDSVSPCVTAVETANCVEKPIADVINLSLGGGGSASSASSKAANNAALAGAIVVASAGNSGPGASTVGAPCMGTLVICVGASLDPGSISAGAVLAPDQITGETRLGTGPAPETGAASEENAPQPGERQAIRLFNAAGGGPIPGGSLSAHYVYADMTVASNAAPPAVANRIVLVRGTGAFATIANSVAVLNPAAILIITSVESATAVTVLNGIPTYTIGPADANYLIDLMLTGDEGDGDDSQHVPHGTISELPLRVTDGVGLDVYTPAMAGFSSRGPNSVEGSDYRNIKPDVTAPGAGILAAATPDGNPNVTGMGEPSGYIVASGTSFSGPITAGAMLLLRQHVREQLGFDTTDLDDPDYRAKRFEAATIARALLQNTATNLRSGRGVPEADGADSTIIHDLGSGHIDVAAALSAKAIMVAPTKLLGDGAEFDMPALNPPELDDNGHLDVLLPTYAFGQVPVAGAPGEVVKTAKVLIRDVTGGDGAGDYALTWQNDAGAEKPGIAISFLAADGTTPTTSVTVPANGTAEFYVRIAVDGEQFNIPNSDLLWYVTATQGGANRSLRMPFYLRAVAYVTPLIVAAPEQGAPTEVETPATAPACGTDTDGAYTLNFSYTLPENGAEPIGFRIQEGTTADAIFTDAPDEELVAGANSRWSGSPQWGSSPNPETGNAAYYIPDGAAQDEALTLIEPVAITGSATFAFDTLQETEAGFDYAIVEIIADGTTFELGRFSGSYSGTRRFDLSRFAGMGVRIQFRMTSDDLLQAPGWWIENIRIEADDFTTIAEPAADATSHVLTGKTDGTRYYRVAALFEDPVGLLAGPYSEISCVTVAIPVNVAPIAAAGEDIDIDEGAPGALDGSGSSDENGDALAFAWSQIGAGSPAIALDGADSATASFTAPEVCTDTPVTFELTVTDVGGLSDSDEIVVTLRNENAVPVAEAADLEVDEGASPLLGVSVTDGSDCDELLYAWEQRSGPAVALANADTASPSFVAPSVASDTVLVFRVTVTDTAGASASDDLTVLVRDVEPTIGNNAVGALSPLAIVLLGLLGLARRRRPAR